VLFDKTGTLTLGRLELLDRNVIGSLSEEARDAAYDMSARSSHPVSRCLAQALARTDARFTSTSMVRELPGKGLELERDGAVWRLGAPGWATETRTKEPGRTVLSRNGVLVASFALRESIRPDARREAATLERMGHEVWIVSGDSQARVNAMAEGLGIRPERALGDRRPEQKADDVARIGVDDTLYLGDGVNDSLAFERALCAGTPAIDRPVMPGKADFFLLGEGLSCIRESLELARSLRRAVTRGLAFSAFYNLLAITACLSGHMTPLRAAIAMPMSSITAILLALWNLRERPRPVDSRVAVRTVEVPT
jgi:Cu2+-exporting ATPase